MPRGYYKRTKAHKNKMSALKKGKDPFAGRPDLRKRQADKLRTGGINACGYRRISVMGKRWLEHRWIWEQHHGPVPKGYEIHHKNCIRTDNRLENLELMRHEEHMQKHKKDR